MAKSQDSFSKREKEKKRLQKRQEKQVKKDDRKTNSSGGEFENMIAYVDENGNLTDTPPDPSKRKKVNVESIEIGVRKREDDDVPPIHNGKVDFFNTSKGFGFIKDFDTQERYFVHVSAFLDDVQEEDKVTFELERGVKGMNAVRVKKA